MSAAPARPHGPRLAGAAYWAMLKRVALAACCIDFVRIALYLALGAPWAAALNIVTVFAYAAVWLLLQRRANLPAVLLMSFGVLGHTAVGSLMLGWEAGYHYYLLMFIPAVVVSSSRRDAGRLVVLLLALYLALNAVCTIYGPQIPLTGNGLLVARWFNIVLVFGLFYTMASFYRVTVVKAERKLLEQATTDPLTLLANRAHFQSRASSELVRCRRSGEPLALVLGDIDHFKRINDSFGHDAGDKVLVRVASVLKQNLRDPDVLARWGGEEFLALLPGSDSASAASAAERFRQAVEATAFDAGGRALTVTMSFGVTQLDGSDGLAAAIQRADRALYASKDRGRNRVSAHASGEPAAEVRGFVP